MTTPIAVGRVRSRSGSMVRSRRARADPRPTPERAGRSRACEEHGSGPDAGRSPAVRVGGHGAGSRLGGRGPGPCSPDLRWRHAPGQTPTRVSGRPLSSRQDPLRRARVIHGPAPAASSSSRRGRSPSVRPPSLARPIPGCRSAAPAGFEVTTGCELGMCTSSSWRGVAVAGSLAWMGESPAPEPLVRSGRPSRPLPAARCPPDASREPRRFHVKHLHACVERASD